MSNINFNEHQQQLLKINPNVASVSDRAIQYTPQFKIKVVKENLARKSTSAIFIARGFEPIISYACQKMELKQSMSRKGSCLDNAPMESFFGHLKDEGKALTNKPLD